MSKHVARSILAVTGALGLLTSSCQGVPVHLPAAPWSQATAPADAPAAPAAAATQQPSPTQPAAVTGGQAITTSRPTAPVRRGTISEAITLLGRVVGDAETPLNFSASGDVARITVKPGQTVDQGQLLMEADSQKIADNLDASRARLEVAQLRLDYAHATAQGQRDQQAFEAQRQAYEAQRQANDAAQQRAQQVSAAEDTVRRAQAELDRARDDATAAVNRSNLADVTAAQARVTKAEAELARVSPPIDAAAVAAVERDITRLQSEVVRLQAVVDQLKDRENSPEVRAARRNLQRAQQAFEVARSTPVASADTARQTAAIAAAWRDVQQATDDLNQALQPPSPAAVEVAESQVRLAQMDLDAAKQRLATLKAGPDPAPIAAATAELADAQAALDAAQEQAQASYNPNSSPTVRRAASDLASAQAALDQARSRAAAPQPTPPDAPAPSSPADGGIETTLLERTIAQEQSLMERLQRDLDATHLTAPFAGIVTAVNVQSGDHFTADTPVVVLSKSTTPLVNVPLDNDQVKRVAVGQSAVLRLDASPDAPLTATVAAIVSDAQGVGSIARLQVDWQSVTPRFGASAETDITVQQKNNVLLIPKTALHMAGQRASVDVLDGGNRRTVDVEAGITSGDNVEIRSGLREGQFVLVG
jgi:multidrug efflux pump subunit AcrA (membrane-fusion protein)